MALEQKLSVLTIFLIREMVKSEGVEDIIAIINGLDGDVDGVRRGVFVYVKFRDKARASPQIFDVPPQAFYFCVDGLDTDDDTNVNVVDPINVVEQSVDSDRSTALARSGKVVQDVEHFRLR
jgi:hypothetical protein